MNIKIFLQIHVHCIHVHKVSCGENRNYKIRNIKFKIQNCLKFGNRKFESLRKYLNKMYEIRVNSIYCFFMVLVEMKCKLLIQTKL